MTANEEKAAKEIAEHLRSAMLIAGFRSDIGVDKRAFTMAIAHHIAMSEDCPHPTVLAHSKHIIDLVFGLLQ